MDRIRPPLGISQRAVLSRTRRAAVLFSVASLWSTITSAQEASPAVVGGRSAVNVGLGAILSYQPQGYDGTGGPYLDNSLGGVVPGLTVTVGHSFAKHWLVAAEVSSTTSLEVVQSGRFVPGGGPALATHRDSLVSLLSGGHVPMGRAVVEMKGGISLAFGKPKHGDLPVNNDPGRFGVTLGLDGVARIGQKLDIVPSLRYSHVLRGDNAMYVGLGTDILRVGVGVRIWLSN